MEEGRLEFIDFVTGKFDELKNLFIEKQKQYGTEDPLANFRTGALMNSGTDSLEAMFKEAWSYESKHIAHVKNHGINGHKTAESLADIAVYSLIEMYMIEKHKQEGGNVAKSFCSYARDEQNV